MNVPEHSSIPVYLCLSVSVSLLGAVPLCINKAIAILSPERDCFSHLKGRAFTWDVRKKSIYILENYEAESSGFVAIKNPN